MIQLVPIACLLLVLAATLWRGIAVRREGGVGAFAFLEARGRQRAYGALFGLSTLALFPAALQLALSDPARRDWMVWVAAVLALAGALIVVVAQRQMKLAWRVGVREGDAPLFVRSGLFRFSRNPIFVGMVLMALAIALASGTWWAWLAAGVFALACHLQVTIEEPHLAAQFGDAYEEFRREVPRWLLF